jgi:23S rRNA-intervening sequence protein
VGSSHEFARYLAMAIGSAEEAKLWCRYAHDLGYVADETAGELARPIRPNSASVDEAARERPATFRSLITDNRSPDGSGAFRFA